MAIITISRGSYSKGKQIAEQVAEKLGYDCLSRDILLEASEHFRIPEVKLVRALHDAPSVLSRFTHGREKYVAFIREAFLSQVQRDNVVYHGLAGHFFVNDVSHVLKVRVIADIEDRVEFEMEREKISRDEALHLLRKDDEERRKWSMQLYGIDTTSPMLYDLVIHIRKFTIADAVEMIRRCALKPQFSATPESEATLKDLLLAAKVKSAIVTKFPLAEVSSMDGVIVVQTPGVLAQEALVAREVQARVEKIDGVKSVRVGVRPLI